MEINSMSILYTPLSSSTDDSEGVFSTLPGFLHTMYMLLAHSIEAQIRFEPSASVAPCSTHQPRNNCCARDCDELHKKLVLTWHNVHVRGIETVRMHAIHIRTLCLSSIVCLDLIVTGCGGFNTLRANKAGGVGLICKCWLLSKGQAVGRF